MRHDEAQWDEIRVLAATGVCGSGFREASLAEAMRRQPHFIGSDCGSTDPGPHPLGAGATAFPRVAIKRNLRLMLLAAQQAGILLLLGSAGTAGGAPHVAAEVVLAGRSSDTAIFAGIPMRAGVPAGIAWHAAKILECGAASVEQRTSPDCLMATCRPDHFEVEPLDPVLRCTPQSIASHSLYENADPYMRVESSGTIDLSRSQYEALDDRRVRVTGSQFIPAETYTVKLEGAEKGATRA